MRDEPRIRLLWVTNLSAPYRRPVWAALARHSELSVALLGNREPNRRWSTEVPVGVRLRRVRTLRLTVSRLTFYLLLAPVCDGVTDVIVLPGWEHPAAWQLLWTARRRGVATIGFYESTLRSQHLRRGPAAWVRQWFFRRVDAVLTVGAASRNAVATMGVSDDRVMTTHNSIDAATLTSGYDGCDPPAATRAGQIVYVGQLIRRKNVDGLIRAVASLGPTVLLDIVGEGPEARSLRELAAELGVGDQVNFLGYVPPEQLATRYRRAATLVLPSTEEVHGMVVVEALTLGLHVVVSDRAGIAADVEGMRGVWISGTQPDQLASAIQLSVDAWTGEITHPEVTEWTAESFADDVLHAVRLARRRVTG